MIDFFGFWVGDIWGSPLMALLGTAGLYAIIGVLGRMSYFLLFTLLGLYFVIFGIGFYGMVFWLPMFLFSITYFFLQMYKFLQKTD